jgi:primosomal replication protein N
MSANQIVLDVVVARRDAPRRTPGGVASLSLTFSHQSVQQEDGHAVNVDLEIEAIAYGEVAEALEVLVAGSALSVKGFLSRKNRFSDTPVLHITQFKI